MGCIRLSKVDAPIASQDDRPLIVPTHPRCSASYLRHRAIDHRTAAMLAVPTAPTAGPTRVADATDAIATTKPASPAAASTRAAEVAARVLSTPASATM